MRRFCCVCVTGTEKELNADLESLAEGRVGTREGGLAVVRRRCGAELCFTSFFFHFSCILSGCFGGQKGHAGFRFW